MAGVLDGKNSAGRSRVRHIGCTVEETKTFDPKDPKAWVWESAADMAHADPFGKRAARPAPENVPALKDFLSEGEDALASIEGTMEDLLANVGDAVAAILDDRMGNVLPGLVALELENHKKLEITVGDAAPQLLDRAHKRLPLILETVMAGQSPMLVGPSGSGKTTAAEQVAKALSLPFYMAARVTSEFKLMGYATATGQTVRTQFREAFEHGGVFLFDEIDASDADALTAFNASLGNGIGDFPDGMVKRHKDFHALAAANTYGRGADRQYVGRNQLDAATLDRFGVIEVDYDEELELALVGDTPQAQAWCVWVQSIRAAVAKEKVRHIVSPRASIGGAKMLARGIPRNEVEEAMVWKGIDAPTKQRVTLARVAHPTRASDGAKL